MRKLSVSLLSAALIVTALAAPAVGQSNWSAFWRKFKTAVVKGDKRTISKLSNTTQIPGGYSTLFGDRDRKRCFARAKPVKENAAYYVFCDDQGYLFEKVNGQFRFVEGFFAGDEN